MTAAQMRIQCEGNVVLTPSEDSSSYYWVLLEMLPDSQC